MVLGRLQETLEFAEDMQIDIPKIWQYLGELIGPMVQDGCLPLTSLRRVCEPLSSMAGVLVAEILHDMARTLVSHQSDAHISLSNATLILGKGFF